MTEERLPWMPWDIPAYMGDTIGFKVEHHGAYMLLLAAVWMGKGRFKFGSMDDLMDAAQCTPEQWERVRAKVLAKFDVDEDGCLTQKRLADEWTRAGEVRVKRKAAGKAGGEAKAARAKQEAGKPGSKNVANAKQTDSTDAGKDVANGKQKGRQLQLHSSTNVEDSIGHASHDRDEPAAPTPEDVFDAIWALYPKRSGRNSKADAFKAFAARRKAGVESTAVFAGVRRYAAWCEATGKIGTEFVMQGSTFFGPGHHHENAFDLPAPRATGTRNDQRAATLNGLGTPYTGEPQHGKHQHDTIEVDARLVPDDDDRFDATPGHHGR